MKLLIFMIIFTSPLFGFSLEEDKNHQNLLNKLLLLLNPVTISEFPYLVTIFVGTKIMDEWNAEIIVTYGSIVHEYWVLTFGDLVAWDTFQTFLKTGHVFVRGNATCLRNCKGYGIDHKVIYTYEHKKWNMKSADVDSIALVKVDSPFKGIYEKPLRFNPPKEMYKGNAIMVGLAYWEFDENHNFTLSKPRLSFETVKMTEVNKCQDIISRNYTVNKDQRLSSYACALRITPVTCPGMFSGGWPVVKNNYLLGMVPFNIMCIFNTPVMFIKSSLYTEWINAVIRNGRA